MNQRADSAPISMTKTTFATIDDHTRAAATWYVVDASQHTLGRMAVVIAETLMGKNRPLYTPHINVGAGVIVINAEKVKVTGQKREKKEYHYYTGHLSGRKTVTMAEFLDRNPAYIVTAAVRRMLPKSRMGKYMLSRLKVYTGPEHPHRAQQPTPLEI